MVFSFQMFIKWMLWTKNYLLENSMNYYVIDLSVSITYKHIWNWFRWYHILVNSSNVMNNLSNKFMARQFHHSIQSSVKLLYLNGKCWAAYQRAAAWDILSKHFHQSVHAVSLSRFVDFLFSQKEAGKTNWWLYTCLLQNVTHIRRRMWMVGCQTIRDISMTALRCDNRITWFYADFHY